MDSVPPYLNMIPESIKYVPLAKVEQGIEQRLQPAALARRKVLRWVEEMDESILFLEGYQAQTSQIRLLFSAWTLAVCDRPGVYTRPESVKGDPTCENKAEAGLEIYCWWPSR
jgi:hypothetical protein